MRFVRTSEIQPARKELKQIWRSIWSGTRGCVVPTLPGEPPESNVPINGHIIGESCLEVIARDKHVYEWPNDPTIRGDSAVKGIKAGDVTEFPRDLAKAIPFKDRGSSISKCVWRFACKYHDNKAFKLIETPDMELASNTVQFLLGFRTIAATSAWTGSYLRFFDEAFLNRNRIRMILRKYPQSRSAIPYIKQETNRLRSLVDRLREELGRWQAMYGAKPVEGYSIMTCRRTVRPVIRCAGAGVPAWCGNGAILATILPKRQDGQSRALCDIVITCLRPKSWLGRLYLRWRINRVARSIAMSIRKDPVANIPTLANALTFFYVSPDDFDSDSILDDEQRREIYERIASDRTPI